MRIFANIITKGYKYIIALWIVLAIAMAYFAVQLPSMLEGDGFEMDAEHAEVMKIATDKFDVPKESLFLVFEKVKDTEIKETIRKVTDLKVTSEIISPLEDSSLHKKDLSYALLNFDGSQKDMSETVQEVRDSIGDKKHITVTGEAALEKDINAASQRDLMIAEAIGLPIALVVLVFAFGTIVASLIPIMIGVSAILLAFGILAILGNYIDLSIFILNIIPMLGLALSIDFALLFISRYREERQHSEVTEAVATTIRTAGRSVLFSAFCVIIGLGALFFIQVAIFENIALGGMIVVAMAVFSSITLLPAVLIALGDKIEKWKVLKPNKNGTDRWRNFANGVIKRPVLITLGALILLGVALIPIKNMELTIPEIDSLPMSYDTRMAFEKVEDGFGLGEESSVFMIANREDGWQDEAGLKEMKKLEDQLKEDEEVKEATTLLDLSGIDDPTAFAAALDSPAKAELEPLVDQFVEKDQLFIPITLNVEGSSNKAQDWARDLNKNYGSFDLKMGGEPRFNQEIFDEISDKILYVLLTIIVSTFFVLMYAFRSILIPVKAILMNVIGLAATFGILVYIFQYGHFGLEPGSIALIIPVIVFSLVFGLSMDYEVFLITRMQEEYVKTLDNDKSTVEGLAKTSKIITSAALIMIVLTGAFAFTDVLPVKQIGVGIAIAVAIDATIIRLLLVPSLMKLFGKWNWWLPFRKGPYRTGGKH